MRRPATDAQSVVLIFLGPPHSGEAQIEKHLGMQGFSVLAGLKGRHLLPHRLDQLPRPRAHHSLFTGAQGTSAQVFAPSLLRYLAASQPDAKLVLNLFPKSEWLVKAHKDTAWMHALQIAWGLSHDQLTDALGMIYDQHAGLADCGIPILDMAGDWTAQLLESDAGTVTATPLATPALGPAQLPPNDTKLLHALVDHCVGQVATSATNARSLRPSQLWATWRANGEITNRDGKPLNLRVLRTEPTPYVLKTGGPDKLHRTQTFLNEFAQHQGRPEVTCDFQDARLFGRPETGIPAQRVVTYNRQGDAQNVVLWPLTQYHQPFSANYVSARPIDSTAFAHKRDICVWRGALAGRTKPALDRAVWASTGTGNILKTLAGAEPDSVEFGVALQQLHATTRFNLVERLHNHPSFDFAFARPGATLIATFEHLYAPRVSPSWFHRFKYVASLSGHDTGSNFLSIVNSNSLALKEEDGWELFYTSVYKPWVHYVPLKDGATDIEAKLEWARANPKDCEDITRAARALSAQLAHLPLRRAMLLGIVEEIAQRS